MKQRLLEAVGGGARLKIVNELKRTPAGLPVRDLAARLGMSYMGVKDHCVDLQNRGILDTWRHPQKIGRPQKLYRLTGRAQELFPTASNPLTIELLEAAQRLYGIAAPEKLLLVTYQRTAERWEARLRGDSLAERASGLVRLRDGEGCMSELVQGEESGALCIVEHHSPILDVIRVFPTVAKLEADLFQRLLRVPVRREESSVSGLYCATFHLGARAARA